jgi:hypothetical protein
MYIISFPEGLMEHKKEMELLENSKNLYNEINNVIMSLISNSIKPRSQLEFYQICATALANVIASFVSTIFETDTLRIKALEDILLTSRKLLCAIAAEKKLQ